MARANPQQNSFNSGELSPRMVARVDFAKYAHGAAVLENLLVLPQGGVTRRPGSRFIAAAKTDDMQVLLLPFTFSDEQSYMIEVGISYFRIYRNQGRIEVPTTTAMITNGTFAVDLAGWTDRSDGTGAIIHTATEGGQMRLTGAGVGNEARAYQAVTIGSGFLNTAHLLQFRIRDTSLNLRIGTTVGGEEILPATAKAPGWHSVEFVPGASPIRIEFEKVEAEIAHVDDVSFLNTGPIEIPTPYTSSLRTLRTAQSADVMWMVNSLYRVQKLSRTSHLGWSLTEYLPLGSPFTSDARSPAAVGFFEQRLWFGGSRAEPQRLWATVSGDFEDMRLGAGDDDDAIQIDIASEQVDRIYWLSPGRDLVVGTAGGPFVVDSAGAFITPSDISVRKQTTIGAANVAPLRVGTATLFLERALRKIYRALFSFDEDALVADDLSILADHIAGPGILQIAFAQDPDSQIWAVRKDGLLLAMTYKPEHEVVGWTRHIIGGTFNADHAMVDSVATIAGSDAAGQVMPSDERDEVWMVARRTIDGSTRRYIEMLERPYVGLRDEDYATATAWQTAVIAAQQDAFYVDSGLTYDGPATDTMSGLDHLEGETVAILGNGAVLPTQVVTGGTISFTTDEGEPINLTKAHVGLPAPWRLLPLKMPYGASAGTGVGKIKRIGSLGMVLDSTAAFQVAMRLGGATTDVELRTIGDAMDTAVPLFTGEILFALDDSGYETDPRFWLTGGSPAPFTCLALLPEMDTHDVR